MSFQAMLASLKTVLILAIPELVPGAHLAQVVRMSKQLTCSQDFQ